MKTNSEWWKGDKDLEIILGIILLLQVLVSIQIMLFNKQMLLGFEKNEQRLKELEERISSKESKNREMRETVQREKKEFQEQIITKEVQEALINEVLSEVF